MILDIALCIGILLLVVVGIWGNLMVIQIRRERRG
jgi:hypothetical protein